jgi:hypothetical protein
VLLDDPLNFAAANLAGNAFAMPPLCDNVLFTLASLIA